MIEEIRSERVVLQDTRGDLRRKALEAPEGPGVYIFKGEGGEILYVGKARFLRNRVRSYFGQDLPPKTRAMMERATDVEFITADSEAEALILESNLVKKHKPRYNILLKDDKHYPYLRVGLADEWPGVTIARRMKKDGARYFGPYTRAGAVRETLKLLRKVFPYRTCKDTTFKTQTRPCLEYHLGRCPAPCAGLCSRDAYMETIEEVVRFLEGKHREVRDSLERRMKVRAESLDFEGAAKLRDQIRALDQIMSAQKAITADMKDRDVLGFHPYGEDGYVAVLVVREGRLLGREGFKLVGTRDEPLSEVLVAFIAQYYSSRAAAVPEEILVPDAGADTASLENLLRQVSGHSVKVLAPKRGFRKDLVDMAMDNARVLVSELVPLEERKKAENQKAMEDLARELGLPVLPRRIEGYDVSNTGGKDASASLVVLQDGKPDKSSYRRFKISLEEPNDYAMMEEALRRRFSRGLQERREGKSGKFSVFPDLILVDGGKGQVSVAAKVLRDLGLDIPVAGLAKKNEEIYLPSREDPLVLPRDSGALFLVMRLRNEAHRFALSYHRKLRSKRIRRSALDAVPGLGEERKKALLAHFGSVERIATASSEEIQKLPGIGPALAAKILEALSVKGAARGPDKKQS